MFVCCCAALKLRRIKYHVSSSLLNYLMLSALILACHISCVYQLVCCCYYRNYFLISVDLFGGESS